MLKKPESILKKAALEMGIFFFLLLNPKKEQELAGISLSSPKLSLKTLWVYEPRTAMPPAAQGHGKGEVHLVSMERDGGLSGCGTKLVN